MSIFEISTSWVSGLAQITVYALILGAGVWILSKIEIKEKEGDSKAEARPYAPAMEIDDIIKQIEEEQGNGN